MKRTEIEKDYTIINGRITSPGKFEGEMLYVPHFYDIALNGFADRDDGRTWGFDITKEDKAEFPELKDRHTVKLYVNNDGFVMETS